MRGPQLGLDAGTVAARLHADETDTGALAPAASRRLEVIRRIGTTASVAMAIGALGAAALPVLQNPLLGSRFLGVWLRMSHTSMTIVLIGMVILTMCWLLLGRYVLGEDGQHTRVGRMNRLALERVIASWAIPLALAPPMFSKDVYSYLAQGAIADRLSDPYALGPISALGTDHPLTVNVPDIWRDTPNQYGPVFLGLQRLVFDMTGDNVIAGTAVHRVLAVIGILMLGWAVPRLAERCGVSDVAALWLAVANPLVLFHLVSGIHSEALMMGVLAVGLVLAFRALDNEYPQRWTIPLFVVGTVLVTSSALVKLPTVVALGFVGMALAAKRGGGVVEILRASAVMALIAGATTLTAMAVTGSGFGWITKLGAATVLRSWLSPPTALGVTVGGIGQTIGLGDHTPQILELTQAAGLLAAAAWTVWMLLAVHSGRVHPLGGFGLSMAGIVLGFPVVHPWYVVWALIPLAAWATSRTFRRPVIVVSAILALFTLPPGAGLEPFVTVQSWIAATVVCATIVFALFRWPGLLRKPQKTALDSSR